MRDTEYSIKCKHCGHEITGRSEEELLEKTREHNRMQHNTDTNEKEVREMMEKRSAA